MPALIKAKIFTVLFFLCVPTLANIQIAIYVDGQVIGTLQQLDYKLSENKIEITTNEIVFGCKQDRLIWDRFEQ